MENTPPLDVRKDALIEVIELLGKRDRETQIRILKCAVVFLGLPWDLKSDA